MNMQIWIPPQDISDFVPMQMLDIQIKLCKHHYTMCDGVCSRLLFSYFENFCFGTGKFEPYVCEILKIIYWIIIYSFDSQFVLTHMVGTFWTGVIFKGILQNKSICIIFFRMQNDWV